MDFMERGGITTEVFSYRNANESKQSDGNTRMGQPCNSQECPMLPWVCQFLPPVHCTVLYHCGTINNPGPEGDTVPLEPGLTKNAFITLKQRFVHILVVTHPDPTMPFMVETNASDVDLDVMLSQPSDPISQLRPSAFLSQKLPLAEKNYKIAEKELHTIKIAPATRCHYLEGACHPVCILINHKNLEYLHATKALTQQLICWALLLQFPTPNHLSSRNLKCQGRHSLQETGIL